MAPLRLRLAGLGGILALVALGCGVGARALAFATSRRPAGPMLTVSRSELKQAAGRLHKCTMQALIKEKRPPIPRPPREKRMTEAQKTADAITHAVVAVELLHWHGKLAGNLEAAFRKCVYTPLLPRLRRLTDRDASAKEDFRLDESGNKQQRPSRVHDQIVERQFTLGHCFSNVALGALNRLDQALWNSFAKMRSRQAFIAAETKPLDDPEAKTLAAWSSGLITKKNGDLIEIADRPSGNGDGWSNIWILPVFVDHDRSSHSERQALLMMLQHVNVDRKTEGVEDGSKGQARVYATHTPCISCLSSMCQFTRCWPGATVKVTFDTWKETKRWIGFDGPDMQPMGMDADMLDEGLPTFD